MGGNASGFWLHFWEEDPYTYGSASLRFSLLALVPPFYRLSNSHNDAEEYFSARDLVALAQARLDCMFRYFLARQGGELVGRAFGYGLAFLLCGPLGLPVGMGEQSPRSVCHSFAR